MDDRLSAAVPSRDGVRIRGPVQPMGPTRPGRGDPAGSPLRSARVAVWAGADVSAVVRRAALALQSHDQAAGARAVHDAGAGDVHRDPLQTARGSQPSVMTDRPAFLFDLDGTLVDSVYQHVLAWREALESVGIELSVWRIHRRIGMSGGLFVHALFRETGRELKPEQAAQIRRVHAEAYARQVSQGRTGCTRIRRTSWTTSTRWGCGPAARRREVARGQACALPVLTDPEHPELIRWPASAPRYEHAGPAVVDQRDRHREYVILPGHAR